MLVVYLNNTNNFDNLGLGVLKDFKSNPEITEVLNGMYNLEFDYVKDGWLSEYLVEGNIIKANKQLFRIRNIKKDIKDSKITILAKHIWFDMEKNNWLLDVAPTNKVGHTALEWILARTEMPNRFKISGDCTKISSARYVQMNPIEAIYNADNALLNRFGGELEIDNFNITLHRQRGKTTGIEIRQKKNLTGASYEIDLSSLATRLIPVGKNGLLLPETFVDSPLINNYYAPFYYKFNVDVGVDENNNVTEDDCYREMRKAAQNLLDSGIDKPNVSIKIDFVELSKTKEYTKYSNLETANLGDSCRVHISDLNLDLTARIVKTVYDCAKKRIIKLELGTPKPNYVSNNLNTANELKNSINKIDPVGILEKARNNATQLIKHPFNGHILISENTGELYIMDSTDINTAKNIWKFGLGGIGFSNTGINGTYKTAWTQDGSIVADFITSGKLNTSVIEGYSNLVISIQNAIKKGTIISEINLSDEEIKILAEKIALEGFTTINGAFIIDSQGNPIIKGGNITLIDTGENSDPTIEIYDKTAMEDSTVKVGDNLSGQILKFNFPSNGSAGIDKIEDQQNVDKIIFKTDAGYELSGGFYWNGSGNETYSLYKEGKIYKEIYRNWIELDTSENEVDISLSELTLPEDIGNVIYIDSTAKVYDLIFAANVKNKYTTYKSSGFRIYDKTKGINTNYSSNGLSIIDYNGSKYFNQDGLLWRTNYANDFSEFVFNKLNMLFASKNSWFHFDCDYDDHNQDNLYVKINGNEKMRIDQDGVKYSSISALSLKEFKKDFEKLKSGLSIIKNTDIYKFHLKDQKEEERKHIGFVIGDNYNYSEDILNTDGTGVDLYSMASVAFKAIQEQQEEIELLKQEVNKLKKIMEVK